MTPHRTVDYAGRKLSDKTPRERIESLTRTRPAPTRPWNQDLSRNRTALRKSSGPPDLTPVKDPLTPAMARHLLRRTGFGARFEDVERLVGMPADEAVASIMRSPNGFAVYRSPGWEKEIPPHADASEAAWEAFFELNDAWTRDYLRSLMHEWSTGSLTQKMMLFWHDHFATSYDKYELATFAVQHLHIFRSGGLGDFRLLVRNVGMDPAMLLYLDGFLNDRFAPNENYARELLELFTIGRTGPDGRPNYTENDVSELARALTGWAVDYINLRAKFYPNLFDSSNKVIFGKTSNFSHTSGVSLIFSERGFEMAYHIAGKLFREFVHQEPDHETTLALAAAFQFRNFNVGLFLQTLLSSGMFFDSENAVAARIKSPVELLLGQVREFGIPATGSLQEAIYFEAADAGQQVLFPPNVAGWSGHTDWLSTSTLPVRWSTTGWFTYFGGEASDTALLAWAIDLAPPQDAADVFRLTHAILEHLMPVPIEELGLPRRPAGMGGDLRQFPIPDTVRSQLPAESIAAAADLLSGIPWYEWNVFQPQALGLIRFFVANLFRRPEFQLM